MTFPVFLTGRFRSGSTLVWNLLRQLDEVVAYYEPLHPKLLHHLRCPPKPQPRHFHVASYFDEYGALADVGRYHSPEFGVTRLHLEAQDDWPDLERYVRFLVGSVGPERTPVLKFNRIDFRLAWARRVFPDARVIHVWRSARDEWASLLAAAGEGPDPAIDADPFHLTTWSRDLGQSFPFLATGSLRHLYQRHYYLWKLSKLAGCRLGHLSVSYEELLASPRADVGRLLDAAALGTDVAVEKCLGVVTTGSRDGWRKHHDPAWFDDLEAECEAQLDRLGLNALYGFRQLSQIIDGSPAYRTMVAESGESNWALRTCQVALSRKDVECDEKEGVLQGLARTAEERLRMAESLRQTIGLLEAKADAARGVAEAHLRGMQETERTVRALEKRAENAEAAAEARLRVIEEQERALRALGARRLREWLRRLAAPRLGVLYQHPPRPLDTPSRYRALPAPSPCLRLSIVTPSLNQGAFIRRTIDSVLDQQYPEMEYVVRDGGSTDGTVAVLAQYDGRLRYESGPDGGQASAINRGLSGASGEILGYLNADDQLLPGALPYIGRFFGQHPEVDVVYGHRVVIDEYDQEIGRWVLPPHDDDVLGYADYVPQETLFWRRRAWEKVGARLDESFHFALDWDLLLRFRDAGMRFVRLPRFLGAFRVHPHQKTSAEMATKGMDEMDRLRRRCHGRSLGPAEVHRHVRPYLIRHILFHRLYRLGLLRY